MNLNDFSALLQSAHEAVKHRKLSDDVRDIVAEYSETGIIDVESTRPLEIPMAQISEMCDVIAAHFLKMKITSD
jgi:hypothetical protein